MAIALIARHWPNHSATETRPTTGQSFRARSRLRAAGGRVRRATAGGAQIQVASPRVCAHRARAGTPIPKVRDPAQTQTSQ